MFVLFFLLSMPTCHRPTTPLFFSLSLSIPLFHSLSFSQPFKWEPHAHIHTHVVWLSEWAHCCFVLLHVLSSDMVHWLIVCLDPNFMPPPHPSNDSFLPCFYPSLCSSYPAFFLSFFLFIPPLLIFQRPLISTNAVASCHPNFPPYVLCARQPVRVCYCSSSSSPSWLRLVL